MRDEVTKGSTDDGGGFDAVVVVQRVG